MNFRIILLTGIAALIACDKPAQEVHVTGEIKGLGNGQIIIHQSMDQSIAPDTLTATNDRFHWKTKMPEPKQVFMVFPTGYAEVFVEAGNITISGDSNKIQEIKITGSKSQDEAYAYQAQLKELVDETNQLNQRFLTGTPAEHKALSEELEQLNEKKKQKTIAHIKANPGSPFSLNLVNKESVMGSYEETKSLYYLLNKQIQNTVTGQKIADRLTVLKRSINGQPIFDFTQNDINGKQVNYKQFKGKYVLIDFWASWCAPCRAENAKILKIYNDFKNKNFAVIGISLDDNAEKWKKAVEEDLLPWVQLSDLKGAKNEVSTYYGIIGIPSNLLVDPYGKIIARNLRGQVLNQKITEIFH